MCHGLSKHCKLDCLSLRKLECLFNILFMLCIASPSGNPSAAIGRSMCGDVSDRQPDDFFDNGRNNGLWYLLSMTIYYMDANVQDLLNLFQYKWPVGSRGWPVLHQQPLVFKFPQWASEITGGVYVPTMGRYTLLWWRPCEGRGWWPGGA